jgi:hypothetical protein
MERVEVVDLLADADEQDRLARHGLERDGRAAALTIAATGAGLAVLGAVGTAAGQAISRRRAARDSGGAVAGTLAMPASVDRTMPVAAEQRAA